MARKKTIASVLTPKARAKRSNPLLPSGYVPFLEDLKTRIRTAQVKAVLSVNREMIGLYWHIGKSIVDRQRVEGWGKAIVQRLAEDLQKTFPGIGGFSPLNIWRMRAFYLAWTEEFEKLSRVATELDSIKLSQLVTEIPWGQNMELIFKLKDLAIRLWYARKTVEHCWSRAVLGHPPGSGEDRAGGQADRDHLRGRRGRGPGHPGGQQHPQDPGLLRRQGAGLW
jgi:predicted nuclease of restriction endonuclease-like (RecB) superfamily